MSDGSSTVTNRRWFALLVLIATVLIFLAIGLTIYDWETGLFVVVENRQGTSVRNVVVCFHGGRIELGDLSPDEVHRARIRPNSGALIELEFSNIAGIRNRHTFEHEFQPTDRGNLEFRILDGAVGCANLTEPR